MALGLIGGMLSGAGQAIQQNAQSRIQARHDKAMQELKEEFLVAQNDKQWERESKASAAQYQIEEQRRQEDREWDVSDTAEERAHKEKLARIRASRGYGGGGRPPSRILEAQELMERDPEKWPDFSSAYETVRERAGQGTDYGQAKDEIDYTVKQIGAIEDVLNDQDVRVQYDEEELERMAERRDMLMGNLQRLEQETYRIGASQGGNGGGSSSPGPGLISGAQGDGRSGEYPQEGDMVGNPRPSRSVPGIRPGPPREQEDDSPDARAEEILKKFF